MLYNCTEECPRNPLQVQHHDAKDGVLKVNKQDFLQVFQGSGIEKIEDNLTRADPLSYTTTNGTRVDLVSLVSVSSLAHKPTPQFPVEPRI